jgi:hypothetical protein
MGKSFKDPSYLGQQTKLGVNSGPGMRNFYNVGRFPILGVPQLGKKAPPHGSAGEHPEIRLNVGIVSGK